MPKGSPRPNAGAKPLYPGGMSKTEVFLPHELRAAAAALGDGNISAGIRAALAMVAPQPPPPREVQVWRDPADGAHYVVLWQGGMIAAAGPMTLAQATAARAKPPAVWDADLTDVLEARWDRGEMERVDGGAA